MIELRIHENSASGEIAVLEEFFNRTSGTIFERLDNLENQVNILLSDIIGLEAELNDTGWIVLPLAEGITAYNEANAPQYRKIGNLVVIRGTVKGVTARNTVVATMPEGFRPTKANPYVQNTSLGTGNFATQTRMTVTTTGDVKIEAISDNAVFAADKWFPIATMYLIN